ncbi:MAG TPA: DUF1499 domain-containing protein [Paracoccaceae bacterium]|nr:DUF1499 domain-containing protein [Paracoccaceae bacterium]
MKRVLYALLIVIAGGMAWIRLAPDDPARWHVAIFIEPGGGWTLLPPGASPVTGGANDARASVTIFDADSRAVLERLDRIAMASPRTARLAGRPEEGRITWITRSRVFGFPDYTTAEVRAEGPVTVVTFYARARYGRGDFGVNAARLGDWVSRLGGP